MKVKQELLLLLFSIITPTSQAEIVTESEAKFLATRFFTNNQLVSRTSNQPLQLVLAYKPTVSRSGSQSSPSFYVYNKGDNQGFVIISGDNTIKPILAYSYKGTFKTNDIPDNLQAWMHDMHTSISAVRSKQLTPSAEVLEAWQTLHTGTPIVQLETPNWNQDKPYNSLCPSYPYAGWENWHAYTGCTMTATAIVMGYHQWPKQGTGKLSGYQTSGLNVWVNGIDLEDHTYQWENMPEINGNILLDDPLSPAFQQQEEAIAPLMRDLGVLLRAKYDFTATSAMPDMVAARLPRFMKYHEGIAHIQRKYFSNEIWCSILVEELNQHRPILFAGYGLNEGGHSFVLDGYDNLGLFSVNWGWGGISNGFFAIDGMHPSQEGAGGSAQGYAQDQEAVMRIQPFKPNQSYPYFENIIFVKSSVAGSNALPGLHIQGDTSAYTQGGKFVLSAGVILNWGSDYFEGNIKLAITDEKGTIKKELYTTPGLRRLNPGNAVMPLDEIRDFFTITLDDPVEAGDRIRLLYLSKDGHWKAVTTKEPDIQWEILLKESPDDHPTNLEHTSFDEHSNAPVYDITGKQVFQLRKGAIYIKNGKKFRAE